jgi:transcriptional regulator with XRE-family HTH domain
MKNHGMNTKDLIKELCTDALDEFMKRDLMLTPFHDYIMQMCADRGETREHVIKRAGINRTYGHQLFNGTRKPSRDKVIQIAIGFGLDIEQTQQLLKVAQESLLTPKVKRDAAILYCFIHHLDFSEAQKLLVSFDMAALGR